MPSYSIAKHHLAIAKKLEAVERGELTRLIITMPPRAGKTMQISEFFPAWYLGRNPTEQIIYATYSFERASDVGRTVRNLMVNPIHPAVFKGCKISPDSKGANKFSTVQKGNYFAVGCGSAITGRGANVLILDDLIKDQFEADSVTSRQKMIDWFNSVAYTRLMPKNAVILVMTRWRFDDIAGYLIEETADENWEVLNLPAIADEDNDPIGRKIGEPLWPEAYPLERLEQIKNTVGARTWNALYQGQPVPASGGMIQMDWFEERYTRADLKAALTMGQILRRMGGQKAVNAYEGELISKIVISVDTAFKESQLSDPSAFTVWGITNRSRKWLIEVVNKRLQYPDLKRATIGLHAKYAELGLGPVPLLIEDKASGQSLIQDLKRFTKIPIFAIHPENAKEVRMAAVTDYMEDGSMILPARAPWLVDTETQMARFPYAAHDDICDSISQFLKWISKKKYSKSKRPKQWK